MCVCVRGPSERIKKTHRIDGEVEEEEEEEKEKKKRKKKMWDECRERKREKSLAPLRSCDRLPCN